MQYCFPDSKSAETEGKNTLQQQFPLTTGRTKFDKILADQIRKLWNQNNTTKSKVLDVAYRHFTDEGSVSASELIRAMRAGAPDPHRLALVDLRDLPREHKHKIAGAIEHPMPIEMTLWKDFTSLQSKQPRLFPTAAEDLPKAVVFYCTQGKNRSPGMALFYTYWLFQQMDSWGNNWESNAQPPYQVFVLEGGFNSFEDFNPGLKIKECMMLVEEWREPSDTDLHDSHNGHLAPRPIGNNTNIRYVQKQPNTKTP